MNTADLLAIIAAKDAQIASLMTAVERLATAMAQQQAAHVAPVTPVPAPPPARPADTSITVGQAWDMYAATFAEETWGKSVRGLMKAPLDYFGGMRLVDLRRPDWVHYRDNVRRKQVTRMGKPPTASTRNQELVRWKAFVAWCVDQEKIGANVFHGLKKEKQRPPRETVIGDEDLEKLLKVASEMLRAFILVAIDSCMRKTEVRMLKWPDIEASGRIRISWTAAKTTRSRSVRLSERSIEALEGLPHHAFNPYVFANPNTNQPWSDTKLWQMFRDAVDEAGVEAAPGDDQVKFHDTRHTGITRTIQNGTPLAIAMRAAGHVTLAQAARYMHLDETDLDLLKKRNDDAIAAGPRRGPRRAQSTVVDTDAAEKSKLQTHK